MSARILFITGRLAEASLRRVLDHIDSEDFTYEIKQLGVSVAALITADMLKRRLKAVDDFDQILLPGLCAGNMDELSEHYGVEVKKGPVDLKDLPEYFGSPARKHSLQEYSVKIFAEIVDAPDLNIEQILLRAAAYKAAGADVIDIGCLPQKPFPHLESAIQTLKAEGFETSVDSLNDQELLRGGRAGADYLLSLSEKSLWIADEAASTPVLIPVDGSGNESLYAAIEIMAKKNRDFLADSILSPIHFGLTKSIVQYFELRKRYPEVPIMIGTGNVTELTDADTIGITAALMGIASELEAAAILTTEVSGHACTAVAEADLARRMMHAAKSDSSLPRGYSDGLLALHEKKPYPSTAEEIRELASQIRDPSFRIQVSQEGLHIFNRNGLFEATDPFDLYPHLAVEDDASHAFYLGVELARAQIAWQLGKRYLQDRVLSWGCITQPEAVGDEYDPVGTTKQQSLKRDKTA